MSDGLVKKGGKRTTQHAYALEIPQMDCNHTQATKLTIALDTVKAPQDKLKKNRIFPKPDLAKSIYQHQAGLFTSHKLPRKELPLNKKPTLSDMDKNPRAIHAKRAYGTLQTPRPDMI